MVKKVLLIGGGVVLVSLVLFGRDAISYVRTSAGYVTDSVTRACRSSSRSSAPAT